MPCADKNEHENRWADFLFEHTSGLVDRRQLALPIGIGSAVAAVGVLMLSVFDPRTDACDTPALDYLVLKLMFVAGIVVQGTIYLVRLVRLARRSGERRIRAALLCVAIHCHRVARRLGLCFAPTADWNRLIHATSLKHAPPPLLESVALLRWSALSG
jgi:hypothetical protein